MPAYEQANRPFRVETALGPDVFLLDGFAGEEGVSTPFRFTLDLVSEDDAIDAGSLLRTPVAVTVQLADEQERFIHGLVSRFVQLGQSEGGELTSYRAEVVPWLWFLSLSSECKIFQNMSVLEIVEDVFKAQGYSDFDLQCVKSYSKREYCVQYRETHLNFVSRLLEEEGIFYFFKHSKSKHVLTLADDSSAVKPCPGQATARVVPQEGAWQDEDVVTALEREHAAFLGKVTLRDYDYLQPSLKLESAVSGDGTEEMYDYPGMYTQIEEGERLARLQLEEQEQWQEVVRGQSTCRSFQSGYRFDLKEHYRGDVNQAYKLLSVGHSGRGGFGDVPFEYSNSFVAIPHGMPFHPPRTTPKPVVQGSQTALVVGKSGEEIWVDKHGRVKVQFYWDRDGKKDENSSCWVRVSTSWAGKNWGFVQIPRIGQEVIVDFLEGDPDLPLITGRVYNAEQTPPYNLPGNQTQSGVKSRSSKNGTGENFNEIRMEDKKGSEELYIHAEKDENIVVENDKSENVGHDETISIGNDRTEDVGNNETITIGNDRVETVKNNETLTVVADRTRNVNKNETVTVALMRTHSVGVNEMINVGGAQEVTVGGLRALTVGLQQNTTIGLNHTEVVGKNHKVKVGADREVKVGKDDKLDVGKKLLITAGDEITIKTGKASIVMKKDGTINIVGKNLLINGKSGKIDIKADKNITMKGKKILQN